jgi:hypothetical protein
MIQAIAWVMTLYLSGQPGDVFECRMISDRGVQATQTVRLKEANETLLFHVPEGLVPNGVTFACDKSR